MNWIIQIFAILIFLFFFWRKLKDDYIQDQIFSTAFYVILISIFFILLSKFLLPKWWFWFGFLGFLIGLMIGISRFKLRIYETFDAAIFSFLPSAFAYSLYESTRSSDWYLLAHSVLFLVIFLLYLFFNRNYKKFSWYKSGRVGFAGLAAGGVYFLVRAAIAFKLSFMISFVGEFEPILSGVLAFLIFLLIFNLSVKT